MTRTSTEPVPAQTYVTCDKCNAQSSLLHKGFEGMTRKGWSVLKIVTAAPLDDDVQHDYCAACTQKLLNWVEYGL